MIKKIKDVFKLVRHDNKGTITVYQKEYELLKKAAFGDLKERMNAVKELKKFTVEALRHENGL